MRLQSFLLIEDDANDVLFLQSAFKKAELLNRLHVVSDGQKAVDYLSGAHGYADRKKHPLPTCLLLDLNLPHKTGFEVLEWVRRQPGFGTIVVIVLTSSNAESDARRAYVLGANSYVVKPSNPEKLSELAALIKTYWIGWNFAPPPQFAVHPQTGSGAPMEARGIVGTP